MKELFINILLKDRIIKLSIYFSIILALLTFVIIILAFTILPPVIPVFNQFPWGELRIGSKLFIFLPLIIALVFSIINTAVATIIYERIPIVSRILLVTNLTGFLLIFIFSIRTVFLLI